jgi:large subunit ribosomal protein L18
LTGLLAGKRARDKKVKEVVLDLGLQTSTKGSRIYAALKGVLDAGIKVPHSEKILPDEDRIKGVHISENTVKQFEEVRSKIGE